MRRSSIVGLFVLALGVASWGCSRQSPPPQQPSPEEMTPPEAAQPEQQAPGEAMMWPQTPQTQPGGQAMRPGGCPIDFSNASVEVTDAPGGVALVFTSLDPDNTTQLQQRVQQTADLQNRAVRERYGTFPSGQPATETPGGSEGTTSPDVGSESEQQNLSPSESAEPGVESEITEPGVESESAQPGIESELPYGQAPGSEQEPGGINEPQNQAGQGGTQSSLEQGIPALARAENTEDGARLVLIPIRPGELQSLRDRVQQQVEVLRQGGCPIRNNMISMLYFPRERAVHARQ